jgi:hypothetical protein
MSNCVTTPADNGERLRTIRAGENPTTPNPQVASGRRGRVHTSANARGRSPGRLWVVQGKPTSTDNDRGPRRLGCSEPWASVPLVSRTGDQ